MDRLKRDIKKIRFGLLDKQNQLARYGDSHQKCGLIPISKQVTILRSPDNEHSFGGLFSCHSGWCCARCTNAQMAEKGEILSKAHLMIKVPVKPTMLTYTLQHNKGDRLTDLLDVLKLANRVTRSGSRLKRYNKMSYGYVNGTEITYSEKNGWHPHQHEVNYFYNHVRDCDIHNHIIVPYLTAIERSGRIVRDITVKVDEWEGGVDYLTKGSQIAQEITAGNKKSSINIMKVLEMAKPQNKWHWRYLEFCKATKRRKVTNMSKRMREHYNIAKLIYKAKKKEMDDMTEVVHEMTNKEWYDLRSTGNHYEVIATLDG